jgi:aryl sulfotransferase
VKSWWAIRDLPNVLLVHFSDLKIDLSAEIRRIADFLGYTDSPLDWESIESHCGFGYMKSHASQIAPLGGALWDGGAETFIHKGTNRRWADVLSLGDIQEYEDIARGRLGEDCADWLARGYRAAL